MRKYCALLLTLLLFALSPTAILAEVRDDQSGTLVKNAAGEDDSIELVSFTIPEFKEIPVYIAPLGSTVQDLSDLYLENPIRVTACDSLGNTYDLALTDYNFDGVNASQAGSYYITARPDITSYTLAEDVSLPTVDLWLSVQMPGHPQLNCFYYSDGYYYFPWLLSGNDADTVSAWMRTLPVADQGGWQEIIMDGQNAGFTASAFYIKETMFSFNGSYEMQVDYGTSHTNILNFVYFDNIFIVSISEGDRDGGDSDDGSVDDSVDQEIPGLPPVGLPNVPDSSTDPDTPSVTPGETGGSSSETPGTDSDGNANNSDGNSNTSDNTNSSGNSNTSGSTNSSGDSNTSGSTNNSGTTNNSGSITFSRRPLTTANRPAAASSSTSGDPLASQSSASSDDSGSESSEVRESVDGDTMTISGTRLSYLLDNHSTMLPFGWNNLSLEIPVDYLATLALAPEQLLSITLNRVSDNSILLDLAVDGETLTELPESLVRFPIEQPSGDLTLTLDDQALDTTVSYEDGYAVFTIRSTGLYKLVEQTAAAKSDAVRVAETTSTSLEMPPSPSTMDYLPVILITLLCAGIAGIVFCIYRRKR